MRVDLRLLNVPLEELWCEVIAALVFEEPFESQGPVYSIDNRTGGYLSLLRESCFWIGAEGSTLLLPSENKLFSDKIMLRGLGPRDDYAPDSFLDHVLELGKSLALLRCNDLGVWIPSPGNPGEETNTLFKESCKAFVGGYLENHGEEDQYPFFKLIFSISHGASIDLEKTADSLRYEFGSRHSISIVVAERNEI